MDNSVEIYKKATVEAMDGFLRVFSFVPDDRLNWTPTPTAKSALRIAAHTALYAARFAYMIETRDLPKVENIAEYIAQRDAAEKAITSRAEIEPIFRKGVEQVLAALDSLTLEEMELTLDSGFGWSVPMTWLMNLTATHTIGHEGQIDYLQTCWDDQQVHF